MIQSSLDGKGKMILDSTCSYKRKWPKHATVRIDVRSKVRPDIVMSATDLKFPDNHFDEIYCDPPHLYRDSEPIDMQYKRRLSGRTSPGMFDRYGFWKKEEDWFEFIDKTNKEFARCLKPNGKLFYKITEAGGCTKPKDLIEKMTNFVLVNDVFDKVQSNMGRGLTHYLEFKLK